MKFKLTVFIGKAVFYITFPLIFLVTGILCIIKFNPLTILLGVYFIVLSLLVPTLSKRLLFRYCNEVILEEQKKMSSAYRKIQNDLAKIGCTLFIVLIILRLGGI